MGVLAQLQNQHPQEAIFEVWAQAVVVKVHPKCAERFATSLEWFGSLVVETARHSASSQQRNVDFNARLQTAIRVVLVAML